MSSEPSIAAALEVMAHHIEALNARDEAWLARTLHFPHYRLSGTELKTWQSPQTYFSDFRARSGADWARSSFEDIQVVQASENKVHLDAEINRFDASGRCISQFRSLWVITLVDGRWAAKFRSSFAAK